MCAKRKKIMAIHMIFHDKRRDAERDVAAMSQLNSLSLNQEDWERLIAIMEMPVQVNPHLKKAIKNYKKHFPDPRQ